MAVLDTPSIKFDIYKFRYFISGIVCYRYRYSKYGYHRDFVNPVKKSYQSCMIQ